jgi:hypothetical protein
VLVSSVTGAVRDISTIEILSKLSEYPRSYRASIISHGYLVRMTYHLNAVEVSTGGLSSLNASTTIYR